VTRLQAGRLGFDSRQGQGYFLYATGSRPALGPTQLPIQWVPGAFCPSVKLITHLHPVLRLINRGAVPPLPYVTSWYGAQFSTGTSFALQDSCKPCKLCQDRILVFTKLDTGQDDITYFNYTVLLT